MRVKTQFRAALGVCVVALLWYGTLCAQTASFDVLLKGGRAIDPETGFDGVQDVAIANGHIVAMGLGLGSARELIDVTGLVVAPGFIDLHSHGAFSMPNQHFQVHDGVTTALELEAGVVQIDTVRSGIAENALINYGGSAGYLAARALVVGNLHAPATDAQQQEILEKLDAEISQGAIGIGFLLDYMADGVDEAEVRRLFEFAARRQLVIFVHVRRGQESGDPSGVQEMINMAEETGASVHICHITSAATQAIAEFLRIISEARHRGVDVTTEAYPYTAGSTMIGASVFGRDWQHTFGTTYSDIELASTGERLTAAKFNELRQHHPEAVVIHHYNREEWVRPAIVAKGVMIASDAMPMSTMDTRVHPRSAGTFSRVLGAYVRDAGLMSLLEAMEKMTVLPARRLERLSPAFKTKGRLQVGMDADVVVFDPGTVADASTYEEPNRISRGIVHVLVGGHAVVRDRALVEGSHPGQWMRSTGVIP